MATRFSALRVISRIEVETPDSLHRVCAREDAVRNLHQALEQDELPRRQRNCAALLDDLPLQAIRNHSPDAQLVGGLGSPTT